MRWRESSGRAAAAIAGSAVVVLLGGMLHAQQAEPPPKAEEPAAVPASRTVWDGVYTEEQAKRGEGIYREFCALCHGEALLGREMATPLTGPVFAATWNGVTLGDLIERMRVTMPQNQPGSLSRQQNADLLAFVLSVGRFPAGKTELARQTEILSQIRFLATKP